MDYNTIAVRGRIHPFRHTNEHSGPYVLRIGTRSQVDFVKGWAGKTVFILISQPNEEDNFSLVQVLYLKGGARRPAFIEGDYCRTLHKRMAGTGEIYVRIRKRLSNSFPHPLPTGKYIGQCRYDAEGTFALISLQARSLRKASERSELKIIMTPGDSGFDDTVRDIKKSIL